MDYFGHSLLHVCWTPSPLPTPLFRVVAHAQSSAYGAGPPAQLAHPGALRLSDAFFARARR